MLTCPRCGAGLARERAQLRADVARENVEAMADYFPFTDTERSIAMLAVEGLTYKEIAEKRGTVEQVIKNYVHQIFAITGCSSRSELQAKFTLGTVPQGRLSRDEIRLPRSTSHLRRMP